MEKTSLTPIEYLNKLMPPLLKQIISENGNDTLEEIRVRIGRKIHLRYGDSEKFCFPEADERLCGQLLECLCEHSIYAKEEEIKQGYVTLPGGCRAGICGNIVFGEKGIERISSVSSFNIRIAREIKGCADEIIKELVSSGGDIYSTLLISAPGIGKTTLLRDIARKISDREIDSNTYSLCIADERGEISGANNGVPTLDIGKRSDVMVGAMKAQMMLMMIRSMRPNVIITDEIGSEDDCDAINFAALSGVKIIASAHANDFDEVLKKPHIKELINNGCFHKLALIARKNNDVLYQIKNVR